MCLGLRLHHYNLCFCLHKAFSPCVSVCQIALCLSLVRTPVIGFRVGFHLEILNYICKRYFSQIRSRSQVLRVGLGHYLGGAIIQPSRAPKASALFASPWSQSSHRDVCPSHILYLIIRGHGWFFQVVWNEWVEKSNSDQHTQKE